VWIRDRDWGAVPGLPDVRAKRLDHREACGLDRTPREPPSPRVPAAGTEPGALIAISGRKEATHKVVALSDVLRRTGLGRDDVLQRPDTQHLVSIDSNGKRSEFVSVPVALLDAELESMGDPVEHEHVLVSLGFPDAVVPLSKRECWELYVLLCDDAPFVRHQLNVARHGGRGGVALTTAAERGQVLDRLLSSAAGEVGGGLGMLTAALVEIQEDSDRDEIRRV
jgi:hypothetical protein